MTTFKGFLRYRKAGKRYGFRSKELMGYKQWKLEWTKDKMERGMK